MAASDERCGIVTLLGRTNVGKSTLVNALVGAKVSIVTDRRQTTRRAVHGVLTEGDVQAVFVDTPGLHKPDGKGKKMLRETRDALVDVDLVLAVVEPGDKLAGGTEFLLKYLEQAGNPPALLVINKTDGIEPGDPGMRETVEALTKAYAFKRVFPVSATTGEGLELLAAEVLAAMPQHPFLYPPDEVSNVTQPFYAAEIVREKAMELVEDELPHAIEVEVLELARDEQGYVIHVELYVDRDSRKRILIGKHGRIIKQIRARAREELQELLETEVELETVVRVRKPKKAKPKKAKKGKKKGDKPQRVSGLDRIDPPRPAARINCRTLEGDPHEADPDVCRPRQPVLEPRPRRRRLRAGQDRDREEDREEDQDRHQGGDRRAGG